LEREGFESFAVDRVDLPLDVWLVPAEAGGFAEHYSMNGVSVGMDVKLWPVAIA
jgi:hypothetical protein